MTLYEDISSEQQVIANEAMIVLQELYDAARLAVEKGQPCPPVVASIVADRVEYYHPQWRNDFEREKVFASINDELSTLNPVATMAAFHGAVARDVAPIANPHFHPTSTPAIILVLKIARGQQAIVYPYTRKGDTTEWLDEVILDNYPSSIDHPCVN